MLTWCFFVLFVFGENTQWLTWFSHLMTFRSHERWQIWYRPSLTQFLSDKSALSCFSKFNWPKQEFAESQLPVKTGVIEKIHQFDHFIISLFLDMVATWTMRRSVTRLEE